MKRLFLLFTIMFGMTPIQTEPIHVIRAFEPKSSLFFGSIAPNLITEKLPPKPPEFRYRNVSVLVNNETFEEQISKAKNKKVNFMSTYAVIIITLFCVVLFFISCWFYLDYLYYCDYH